MRGGNLRKELLITIFATVTLLTLFRITKATYPQAHRMYPKTLNIVDNPRFAPPTHT